RWRRQALDSLRELLAAHARRLEGGQPADRDAVRKALREWQQDADLAGVRDAAALAGLPAKEREAVARLWAALAALLKKAEAPADEGPKKADKPSPILPILEEAVETLKARFGPDHARTLTGMHNLALAYRDAGDLDRAVPLFEQTLRLRKVRL